MRKILLIIMTAAMLAAAATGHASEAAAASDGEKTAQTNIGTKYLEAIEFISDLSLISGEINAEDAAQRSALAEIAVLSVGGGAQNPADTPFDDVKSDDPRSGYVLEAYRKGLMKGYSDGKFEPNGSVTLEQLTVVLTRMTGYDAIAELSGGTAEAYVKAAGKGGLLKGVSVSNPSSVTYGELAYAVERALDAEIMDMSGITSDKTVYDNKTGKTLLNSALNMTELKGQITANYYTSLAGASNLNKNQIEIARKVYASDKDNISDYLGRRVTAYIDSDGICKAVKQTEYDNSELTIMSGDIESITDGTVNYKSGSGNISKANYRKNGYLIYNGCAKLAWTQRDLQSVNNGKIRMLDADNDGTYEIIFADQYTDLIINNVSLSDEIIYFKPGASLVSLDISEKSDIKCDLRNSDESKAEIKDVLNGALLSVAMSAGGNVCKLVMSNNKAVGVCSGINEDSIIIEGEEYPLSGGLYENGTVKLNSEGTFYINFLGYVSVFDHDILYNYGYLKRIGFKSGISTEMAFELLTADGTLQNIYLADKVKMNEAAAKVTPADLVGNGLLFENAETIPQLITYSLDSNGKIIKFSTAADGTSMTYDQKNAVFSRDAVFSGGDSDTSTRYIGNNWKMFAGRYLLDENTKIFFIPSDTDETDKYTVTGISALTHESFYGNIQIFDEDENNKVKVLVIPADGVTSINRDSPVGVVKNVKKAADSDGNYRDAVTVISGGKEVVLLSDEDKTPVSMSYAITDAESDDDYINAGGKLQNIALSKLNKGDVICYSAASDGEVKNAEVLFRADSPVESEKWPGTTSAPTANYFYRERYAAYGDVEAVIENGIRVTLPYGDNTCTRVFPFASGTSILRYENGRLEEITAGDIAPGDKVFAYAGISLIKLVAVYR